ncbi:hypothetical protein [Vogesella sp. EB]|uniref:hypothetical protein n=1 Tax=Vogesella sp. EB TaxID=1526735 RepID=UPI0012E04E8D|nr:hypothetical protein [Vogesella sp. EB]
MEVLKFGLSIFFGLPYAYCYFFCGLIVTRVAFGCFFSRLQEVKIYRRILIFSAGLLVVGLLFAFGYYFYFEYEYYKFDLNGDGFVDELEYLNVPKWGRESSGAIFLSLWMLFGTWILPIIGFVVEITSSIFIFIINRLFFLGKQGRLG